MDQRGCELCAPTRKLELDSISSERADCDTPSKVPRSDVGLVRYHRQLRMTRCATGGSLTRHSGQTCIHYRRQLSDINRRRGPRHVVLFIDRSNGHARLYCWKHVEGEVAACLRDDGGGDQATRMIAVRRR